MYMYVLPLNTLGRWEYHDEFVAHSECISLKHSLNDMLYYMFNVVVDELLVSETAWTTRISDREGMTNNKTWKAQSRWCTKTSQIWLTIQLTEQFLHGLIMVIMPDYQLKQTYGNNNNKIKPQPPPPPKKRKENTPLFSQF